MNPEPWDGLCCPSKRTKPKISSWHYDKQKKCSCLRNWNYNQWHAGELTQSCKSVSQVVLVNETVSVLIHYGKSLQKYYCYMLWFQYAQSDIHHRQNCWQSKKKENIWPSTDFFELLDLGLFKHGEHVGAGSVSSPLLGFLGGLQGFDNDTLIRSNIRRCDHHLAHRSASLIIGFYCDTGRLW